MRFLANWRVLLGMPVVPVVALALIAGLDFVMHLRGWSLTVIGILDEPAHFCTSLLVILGLLGSRWVGRHPGVSLCALLCSNAIDLDHVPLYLGATWVAVGGGRPFTHSLSTPIFLALIALMLLAIGRPRIARWPLAAACGVTLHFVRDLATGPGIPFFWPVSDRSVLGPYWIYFAFLVCLAGVAVARCLTPARRAAAGTPVER